MASSRRGSVVLSVIALMAPGCGDPEPRGASSSSGSGGGGGADVHQPPEAGLDDWPCEAGELELADGTCLPAGIPASECGVGFAPTSDASCEPILPAAPCGDGEMALPGERACRAVAPCAAGTWGDIPVEATTQFVDAAYGAADSDGSATKPWTGVQPAIDAVADGGIVAIAAGTYAQALVVAGKRVRLWGRCPSLVRIAATGAAALSVEQGADGSEIRDLSFGGADVGIHVGGGAQDVLVDRVWIEKAGLIGLDVEDGAPGATLTRSLVEDTGSIGVFGYGAELVVEDSVIRDTSYTAAGKFGTGIRVFADGGPTALTVRRTVVSGAWGSGIYASASSVHAADVVVTDVQPQPANPTDGEGISLVEGDGLPSTLDVTRSYVARTTLSGITLSRSSGAVELTVVRDVASPLGLRSSFGIAVGGNVDFPDASLALRSVVVERTRTYGIVALDAAATIEATIVRDTESFPFGGVGGDPDDVGGRGIGAESLGEGMRPSVRISGSRVERTHEIGITALATDLLVESTLVSEVAARETNGQLGRGINAQIELGSLVPSSLVVRRSLVERAHDHGIMLFDSGGTIESTWVRETLPDLDADFGDVPLVFGRGIAVEGHIVGDGDVSATLDRVLVEGSHEAGLFFAGASVEVRRSVVRDTDTGKNGFFGDGIIGTPMPHGTDVSAWSPTFVRVEDTIIERSARVGLSAFGVDIDVSGTYISCNSIDLNGELFFGLPFDFTDGGGNSCVCGTDVRACKVVSSGLDAPTPSSM